MSCASLSNDLSVLEAEKKDIADQQKEVMSEAKSRGYDTKVIRKVIALRKRDKDDIAEEEAVLEMYKEALGNVSGQGARPPSLDWVSDLRSCGCRLIENPQQIWCNPLCAARIDAYDHGCATPTTGHSLSRESWKP